MPEFKCPLCKQTVSEELYQRITGIWKERKIAEREFKKKEKDLLKQRKAIKQQLSSERKKIKREQEQKFKEKIEKFEEERNKIKEQFDKKVLRAVKAAELVVMLASTVVFAFENKVANLYASNSLVTLSLINSPESLPKHKPAVSILSNVSTLNFLALS